MADEYLFDAVGNPVKTSDRKLAGELTETGATPTSKEEASAAAAAKADLDYVDREWGALGQAGMGAASGLTLGLGPAMAARLGLVDPRHLKAAQTSGAFMAGDVAGMIAPALLTGGESAAAESFLGKALGWTPAGLMGKAGGLAESAVGRALGEAPGVLGSLASKPLQMAARGATEAALINMGQVTGESILDNKPLSAQALLAAGAEGALLGGLLGGGLGTVGAIGEKAVEAAGKLAGGGSKAGRVATVMKHLNAPEWTAKAAREMGTDTFMGEVDNLLKSTGSKLSDADSRLASNFGEGAKIAKTARLEVVKDLGHTGLEAFSPRVAERLQTEVMAPVIGTTAEKSAARQVNNLIGVIGKEPITWDRAVRLRDVLAKSPDPMQKQMVNIIDSELKSAMEGVSQELADKYASATIRQTIGEQLSESMGKKDAYKMTDPGRAAVGPRDMAGMVVSTAMGHPWMGAGMMAAKAVGNKLTGRFEPALAQYAFESLTANKAAQATTQAKARIGTTVKRFFGTASKVPGRAAPMAARESKPKERIDRAKYEAMASRVESLVSQQHQDRVRRYAENLYRTGYPEMAGQVLDTNNRAVQYLLYNSVPRQGAKGNSSLRKMPVSKVPTLQEYKFWRQSKGVTDPMSILDDMENGSISRDTVQAMKYVYPDLHSELVGQVTQQVYEAKVAGDTLPVDKIMSLGLALDAPIDSILSSDYIGAVQASLALPPPGEEPQAPAPQAMPAAGPSPMAVAMMTPLQQVQGGLT